MQRVKIFPSLLIIPIISFGCTLDSEVKIGTTNTPPSVSILSPGDGESFDEGSLIHFQAVVNDSYDLPSELTVIWSTDIQGDLNSTAVPDSQILCSQQPILKSELVVTLTAWDTEQAQEQASLLIE